MIRSLHSSDDLYQRIMTKENLKGWAKVGPSLKDGYGRLVKRLDDSPHPFQLQFTKFT